jgi:hypothetical protein
MLSAAQSMLPQENLILEQKAFLKGCQRIEIRPDGDLDISFKRLSTHRQYRIPLWHLDPKPARHKVVHSGGLAGTIIFGLGTLIVIWGIISNLRLPQDRPTAVVLLFPLALVGGFFAMCFWRYKTLSIDATVFYFRGEGQLHIWSDKPDANRFSSFCEVLSKKAEESWNHRPVEPGSQSIAGEIAALKKLNSTGVLTDAEFERAKAKLLEQAEEKRIGFV